MDTEESSVRAWFQGRLPEEWRQAGEPEVVVDREEVIVLVRIGPPALPDGAGAAERAEARAGRVQGWREETRERRMAIAREAEHRFGRKVAWGVRDDDGVEMFTHLAVPVMTRLRQRERMVLDTLVAAGVARSRAHALAWCVRLVADRSDDWLSELREAMEHVERVRQQGPRAS